MANKITCKLRNFQQKEISITFNKEGTIDEYIKVIENWVKKNKWFAKTKKESLNPEELNISINKLFDELSNKVDLLFGNKNLKEAIEQVRKDLLDNIDELSDNNQGENLGKSPELPDGDLPKNKDKNEETLKNNLKELFGGDRLLRQDFLSFFNKNIYQLSIAYIGEDVEHSRIIRDNETITEGMMQFLNDQYKIIYNFLKDHNVSLEGIKSNMFIMSTESDNYGHCNPSYPQLLEKFIEYIRSLDNGQKLISDNFENKYSRKDFPVLKAVYAYLSVQYFNDLLIQNYGKYFYVDKQTNPIDVDENGNRKYKYSINRRQSQLIAGFETNVVRDGLKEQGVFSTKIMEQIPLLNSIGYLDKTNVITTLLKLQYTIEHYNGNNVTLKKLKTALLKTDFNLVEGWKEVMELVHGLIKNNSTTILIKNSQEGNKINSVDIDNLESIYHYFFNPKNGIYHISRYDTMANGISRNYDIISSVFGGVKSTVQADYMEVVYNRDKRQYETRMKKKSNAQNETLALLRKINDEVVDTNENIDNFEIKENGNVKFGNIEISFGEKGSYYGVFSSNSNIETISGIGDSKTMDQYFGTQLTKLSSVDSIEKMLKSDDIKDKEFIKLLEFIDRNLTTDFHTDVLGYQTLRTLKNIRSGNVLQELFLKALRVASARQLNIQLKNKNSKESNLEYIKQNLGEFPNYKFIRDAQPKQFKEYDGENYFIGADNEANSIFDDITKAQRIIRRIDQQSVTKNFEGNNVPNVSVYFTNIIHDFYRQGSESNPNGISKYLLFSGNQADSIISTWIDTDIETRYGETKSVDQFSTSELFYHNFVDKFINPLSDGLFIAQPVTYSDKKKFLNYVIQLDKIYGSKQNLYQVPINKHLSIIKATQGQYYQNLFKKVCNDYRKIFNLSDKLSDNDVFFNANRLMKDKSEAEIVRMAVSAGVEVFKDLHYRVLGKNTCSTNEILCYYNNTIFASDENLQDFLQGELVNYVNQLLNNYTIIPESKQLSSAFKKAKVSESVWMKDEYMLIARKNGVPLNFGNSKITKDDLKSGKVRINPLIVQHFYFSNVINNNIKLGLVGHELHHKIKKLKSITGKGLNLVELQELINTNQSELNNLLSLEPSEERDERIQEIQKSLQGIRNIVNGKIYKLIALAHNAQFKRTVAIPGTIRPYDQGKLDGILPTYNVAFIEDIKAFVHDYKGNSGFNEDEVIDSHDGSAWIDPFTSILENNSLDDSEVGDIKKPLWDIDSPDYGARRLIKYAVNTMTNRIMLNSTRSSLAMRLMFKKMTDNIKWNGNINLVKDWSIVPYDDEAFRRYIINDNNLYYKVGSTYKQIVNFGQDPETGIYYTDEKVVGVKGDILSDKIERVYHLFNENSEHFRYTEIPADWKEQGLNTIDSLYQLHSALGGIYSCSLDNGRLTYSESSNKAVAQFMIYVSKPTESLRARLEASKNKNALGGNNNSNDVLASATQQDFIQPLKSALINCLINDSASKNGTSNINPSSSYYDNSNLNYVSVSTLKYGIQQDSDHEADEALVTEMSQVISALDATGLYHDEVYDVYRALGEQTLNSLEIELNALNELSQGNKNKLYDFVGKMVINNTKDRKGMLKAILDKLEETFNLTTDHKFDRTLCPFSDATIYNKIIQTVASVINKKGIKRKYSGSGMVMAPGFDIYQIWEIDGKPVQYEDLLNLAIEYDSKRPPKDRVVYNGNQEQYNNDVVSEYLAYKLPNTPVFELSPDSKIDETTLSSIDPDQVVTITYTTSDNEQSSINIALNNLRKYYEFKLNTVDFIKDILLKSGEINDTQFITINNISINNSVPRNLAPVRIKFTYQNGLEQKQLNIFDSQIYKELYKAKISENKEQTQLWKSRIKEFLANLENNIYTEWNELGQKITYNVLEKQVKNAETIMSNIYKSNFNIDSSTLFEILSKGPGYFKKNIHPLDGQTYGFDIQLITENSSDNVYISLDAEPSNRDRKVYWSSVNKNKIRIPDEERKNSRVLNRVYLMDDSGRQLIEIGREIDVTDEIEYDSNKKIFIDKATKKEVPIKKKSNPDGRSLFIDGDKVVEYFEFLTEYSIKTEGKSYTKYCINQNNLKQVLLPKEEEESSDLEIILNRELSEIVNSLYKSNSFLAIQPASNIKKTNYYQIRNIFQNLRNEYEGTLSGEYYSNILKNVLSFAQSIKDGSRDYIYLNLGKSRIFSNEVLDKFGIKRETKNIIKPASKIIQELRLVKRKHPEFKEEIDSLIDKYNRTKIEYWNEDYTKKHSVRKYNSFLKSLQFISSRIPAQTLQSFMAMQCVGFTGLNTNYCIVSHFQTFLQGSDYDIDKSYMMGYSFDNNGIYLGWSDLFDYSSIENLTASEKLPMPKGISYDINPYYAEIDVTEEAQRVLLTEGVNRILALANLLKTIYRHPKFNPNSKVIQIKIGKNNEEIELIKTLLEKHEKTVIPTSIKDDVLKNFISSHIQQISSALGNLDESYNPVEMKALRNPASKTEKAQLAESITLYNPATIAIMQNQNMTGKAVTGIAANGQKALFMWRTATLEALNKGESEMVTFDLELSGIEGRSNGEYKKSYIQVLPDLNSDSEFYNQALSKLSPKISSDNIGSQYITAATDNAKELVLACINAGNKMAKCHLYLMSLGFDVDDIVAFMTSKAVSFIDKISEKNIFINYNQDINYIIDWAISYMENPNDNNRMDRVPKILMDGFISELNSILKSPDSQMFLNDLKTLQKVITGANEFSQFGRLLGINQGIPQTKEDLMSWKNAIKNVILQAEKKLYISKKNKKFSKEKLEQYGITTQKYVSVYGKNFSVDRWLEDAEYRKLTSEYYNHIKESLNIFYYLDSIPHFKEMYKGLMVLNNIDKNISIKGQLINEYSKSLRELYPYAPDTYEKRMGIVFNELFIEQFIKGLDFSMKIQEDWNILNSQYEEVFSKKKVLRLKKDSDIASFKYVFEKYIIPKLKNGTLLSKEVTEEMFSDPNVIEFLNGLVTTNDRGIPLYMANINLTLKDIDPSTRLKYQKYLKGLKALKKYKYGQHTISDLFIMYNLIANKNQYGNERLTELFEDFVTDFEGVDQESYMMKYLRFLGREDYTERILKRLKKSVLLKDILLKLAPQVSKDTIGKIKRSDPYIKIFDPNTGYIYYENTTYSNYKQIPRLLVKRADELDKEYVVRQRNQFKYGFGLQYANYITNVIDDLKSDNIEQLEYTFDDIINIQNIVNYKFICK